MASPAPVSPLQPGGGWGAATAIWVWVVPAAEVRADAPAGGYPEASGWAVVGRGSCGAGRLDRWGVQDPFDVIAPEPLHPAGQGDREQSALASPPAYSLGIHVAGLSYLTGSEKRCPWCHAPNRRACARVVSSTTCGFSLACRGETRTLTVMTTAVEGTRAGWVADDSTFGARLALVRQRMHWGNVKEAAEACGLPAESWRRWERDGRAPRDVVEIAARIADKVGCDYGWLLAGSRLRSLSATKPSHTLPLQRRSQMARNVRPSDRRPAGRPHGSTGPSGQRRTSVLA